MDDSSCRQTPQPTANRCRTDLAEGHVHRSLGRRSAGGGPTSQDGVQHKILAVGQVQRLRLAFSKSQTEAAVPHRSAIFDGSLAAPGSIERVASWVGSAGFNNRNRRRPPVFRVVLRPPDAVLQSRDGATRSLHSYSAIAAVPHGPLAVFLQPWPARLGWPLRRRVVGVLGHDRLPGGGGFIFRRPWPDPTPRAAAS